MCTSTANIYDWNFVISHALIPRALHYDIYYRQKSLALPWIHNNFDILLVIQIPMVLQSACNQEEVINIIFFFF